ncbi:Platinum sensitivity protein [Linnemannia schmuckeri]|uniref:Platinum sensitivity protein n=1 Tax=Linnemannia schmuckeri TaxID=64567 RepID=A0A9P5V8E8_9FUNG|nr:Platinum sensitivity protein [Linnemannia schmuckeri]
MPATIPNIDLPTACLATDLNTESFYLVGSPIMSTLEVNFIINPSTTADNQHISVDKMAVHDENHDHLLTPIVYKAQDSIVAHAHSINELASYLAEQDSCSGLWTTAIGDVEPVYEGENFLESEENMTATLPEPTCTNLKDIDARLREANQDEKDQLIDFVVDTSYITNLVHISNACEQADLTSSLYTLRSILLQIIKSGDQAVMEEVIKNKNFVGCIGILEYDPNLIKKAQHRRVFKTHSNAKQVATFTNPRTDLWIHDVIRLTFLQDTVLLHCGNYIVDNAIAALIRTNERNIVEEIINQDGAFLIELFKIAKDPTEPQRRRNDAVKFVHQLFSMGDRIGTSVCSTLLDAGLFQMLEYAFAAADPRIDALGVEILLMAAEERTKLVRSRILDETETNGRCTIFDAIIDKFVLEKDADSGDRLAEVISKLIDVGQEETDRDYPVFLDMFYSEYCTPLFASVLRAVAVSAILERPSSAMYRRTCALAACIIRAHPTRAKLTILATSDYMEFMNGLLTNPDKSLRLAALRFFRACLATEDNDYDALLMENSVTHSVLALLKETQGSNNIINTACLEFFEFISTNGGNRLIIHCATVPSGVLDDFEYSPIFHKILDEYDELLDEMPERCPDDLQDSGVQNGEYDDIDGTSESFSRDDEDCEAPLGEYDSDGGTPELLSGDQQDCEARLQLCVNDPLALPHGANQSNENPLSIPEDLVAPRIDQRPATESSLPISEGSLELTTEQSQSSKDSLPMPKELVALADDLLVVAKGHSEISTDTELTAASSSRLCRKLEHTDFDSDETSAEFLNRPSTAKRTKLDEAATESQTNREATLERLLAVDPDSTSMDATLPQPNQAEATPSSPYPPPPVLRLFLCGVGRSKSPPAPSTPLRLAWSTSFSTHRASTPPHLSLTGSATSTPLPSPPSSPMQPVTLGGSETSDKTPLETGWWFRNLQRQNPEDNYDLPEQILRLLQRPKLHPDDGGSILRGSMEQSLGTTNTQSTSEITDGNTNKNVRKVKQPATPLFQTMAPEPTGDRMTKRKRLGDDFASTEQEPRPPQRPKLDSDEGYLAFRGSKERSFTTVSAQSTNKITDRSEYTSVNKSGHTPENSDFGDPNRDQNISNGPGCN